MSVSRISQQLLGLDVETRKFEVEVNGFQAMHDRAQVEAFHARTSQLFEQTMKKSESLGQEIQAATTFANQEQNLGLVIQLTRCHDRLQAVWNRFNDYALTICPTAKINYGAPCVGPRRADRREIRGDGNCFVSSLTTCYLESLVGDKRVEQAIGSICEGRFATKEVKEELINILLSLQEYPSQLESVLQNNHKILPFVHYFRTLAADEMKRHPEQFEAFFRSEIEHVFNGVAQSKSYNDLIDDYVCRMGVDFSHPMILALCQRLNFNVKIIDPKIGLPGGLNILDHSEPKATFCRQEAHYYVLYPRVAAPVQPRNPAPVERLQEVEINYSCPFGHNLFIRGSGNGLSWDRGLPLIEKPGDVFVWRPGQPLANGTEYKILFDDEIWEEGTNRQISQGRPEVRAPRFVLPVEVSQLPPERSTRITVRCAAPEGSHLTVRGNGPKMSWEHGIPLRHVGGDIWVFEMQGEFRDFEYKILLNETWEQWEGNRSTGAGAREEIAPRF